MKIAHKFFQQSTRGYALLMTMICIGAALLLLGSVMNWANSSAKQAERNNLFNMSTGAAEGATERVIAQMASDFYNQALQATNGYMTASLLPNTTNWPIQFLFGNPYNSANVTYVSIYPSNWTTNWQTLFSSNYAGLHAYVANCTAISTATTSNQLYNVSATVQQQFVLAAIPIFQYAIFYNLNMEIDPGATMTVTGPVFSNGGIWAGSDLLTFASAVTAVGAIVTNTSDPFSTGYTGSGAPTFDSTWTSNADTVAMPIGTTNNPTAIRALLNLPPPGTSPYSVTGQVYFINQANLIISNSSSGTISAFYQNSNNVTPLTAIPYNVTAITTNKSGTNTTYTTNYSYSFATNTTFYDYREGKTVQAVQLNVAALNTWINSTNGGSTYNNQLYADTGQYIDSVYVYNNATASSTNLPAVRLSNGTNLLSQGLTVITPDPLYVLGSFNASGSSLNNGTNVANTAPAALIADAITVLSPNWNDKLYTNGYSLTSRTPTNTTLNAATFEGIVPTVGTNYSGGVENFLRLLENWSSSTTLTYNGSIVVMFPSQYATNKLQETGNYYNAPHRSWAFDVNFMTQNGLPPVSPEVRTLFRQSWANY